MSNAYSLKSKYSKKYAKATTLEYQILPLVTTIINPIIQEKTQ